MPSGAKVGDAWVSVQPETKDFYNKLERQLRDKFKGNEPKIPVKAELDRDQVQREADEKLKGQPVKIRVEPDVDGAKFREEVKREFKARPITVNAALSQKDVARMSSQLQALTRDRRATVHIDVKDDGLARVLSVLDNLNDKDLSKGAVRAKLVLDTEEMDAQIDGWQRRVGVVKLDFDDGQAREKLGALEDTLNEMLGDTYWVDVQIDKKQVAEVRRTLDRLARDEEKKITVRYVNSRAAGQKALRDELERLSADRELRVTYKPNTEDLDTDLDVGRDVSVRPYMVPGAVAKLEEQLDHLTRPRMVEILTGEMNFSGFTEDLGQALQTAWEDMDPRLDMSDVFGADRLKLEADTDAVYKVFVTNQVESQAAPRKPDVEPERVDVARVSTDDPVRTTPVKPQAGAAYSDADRGVRLGEFDGGSRSTLDWDAVSTAIRRGQARNWGVDPDGALKARIKELSAQLERFTTRAEAYGAPVAEMNRGRAIFEGELRDKRYNLGVTTNRISKFSLAGRPSTIEQMRQQAWDKSWAVPSQQRQIIAGQMGLARPLLPYGPDPLSAVPAPQVRFPAAVVQHDKAVKRINDLERWVSNSERRVRYAGAQADNERLHVEYLAREIERLTDQLGAVAGPDLGEVFASRVPEMTAELDELGEELRAHRAELADNTFAITAQERALKEYNLRRLAEDPNAEYVSMRDFKRARRVQGQRVPIDWSGVTGKGVMSEAVDEMFDTEGRGGRFSSFVKKIARSLAMPAARIGDLGWQTSKAVGGAALKSAGGIDDVALLTGGKAVNGVSAAGIDLGLDAGSLPKSGRGGAAMLGRFASRAAGPVGAIAGAGASLYGASATLGSVALLAGGAGEAIAGSFGMASAALAPFAQSLKAVAFAPAMFTSLAGAVGVTAVAWSGLGDAFSDSEEGQEAFAKLSTNAQEFVRSAKLLIPQAQELRKATQDGFFEGWDESMVQVGERTLPALERSLPKVAEGFGGMGRAFMEGLGSEEGARNIERAMLATGEGFDRMQPGMRSLSDFFTRAAAVGAEELLPRLGDGFSDLMSKLDGWGSEANLSAWMDDAVSGLSKVKDFAGTAWNGLSGFFRGAADGANRAFGEGGVWGAMMNQLDRFEAWSNSVGGQNALSNFFEGATESAKTVGDILGEWGTKFVTETMPAARTFLDEHGDSIKNIGSDLISGMTDMIGAVGPIVQTLEPIVSGLAKAASIANELAGGTGSRKSAEEMGRLAEGTEDVVDRRWKEQSRNAYTWDPERNDAEIAAQEERLREMNDRISAEAAAGNADTAGFQSYVDQMERLAFVTEAMKGGMSGATQSVDATVAALSLLGDKIVDIPDEKSIVVKAEKDEQTVQALERMKANVEELEDGKLKISFDNEMDVELAIAKIRQQISDMPEAEIRARGLDTVLAQLEDMQGERVMQLTVQGNAEDVARQMEELGAKASAGINGQVNIDLNDGGTRQWLIDIGAASHINGTFTMNSNAQEVIAEALSLDGVQTSGQHNIGDNADAVRAAIDGIPKSTTGTHTISTNASSIMATIMSLNGMSTSSTHTITTVQNVANSAQIAGLRAKGATGGYFVGDTFTRLPRHAAGAKHDGYQLPGHGPGTERVDGFLALDNITLAPTAWLNRNEWVINEKQSLRNNTLLESINSGRFPQLSDEQVRMLENLPTFAEGGAARSKRLREENYARAKAAADAKEKKKKPKTPASADQIARYEAAVRRGEEIDRMREEGYARKLVGIRNGQFIYADVDPEEEGAVQSIDRAGLIGKRVGVRSYMERDENLSTRSRYMLGAMEASGKPLTEEEKRMLAKLPPAARAEFLRRRDLPPHVKRAIIEGERLEDEDTPINWDRELHSKDWGRAAQVIAANPRSKAAQDHASWLVHDEAQAIGKEVGYTYADEAAGMFGLNFTKLRDIPLYNLFNPSNDAWNEVIGDVSGARRELEGDYRDKYQADRDAYREAERAERARQQAADEAKRKQELFGDTERLAKAITSQDEKNNEELARHQAGMAAVARARRAGTSTTRAGGGSGVVVNQTIGNITTTSVQDAADKFRRQAMIGFENMAGAWK